MRFRRLFAMALPCLALSHGGVVAAAADTPPARVVVLGVNHAAQLVAERDQPGMLAAFIEKLSPAAICVERSPAKYARGDHYEFTYEIQDIVLPYAREHGLEVCPFDWEPTHEDGLLGFGLDIATPPELRRKDGFQGFVSFADPKALRRGLFEAEEPASLAEVHAWIREPAAQASRDLPRRMFLYRTFLQARGIAAAARQRPGQTVLVVVGEFHKYDIEALLADDPAISVVRPSEIGLPAPEAVERLTTRAHRVAMANFNLLGAQAATGNVDWAWVGRVLDALEREREDAETRLLRTRHAVLAGRIDAATAAERYRRIAADPAARRMPTWNGVQDRSRVDSFFDAFGNLRIDQRARVERARALYQRGEADLAAGELARLRDELTPRMALQLEGYWRREFIPSPPPEPNTP